MIFQRCRRKKVVGGGGTAISVVTASKLRWISPAANGRRSAVRRRTYDGQLF